MQIQKNKWYTSDNSDLAIKIINIRYRGSDYVKFKGCLYNKKNYIVYEIKNYKLPLSRISHWKEL